MNSGKNLKATSSSIVQLDEGVTVRKSTLSQPKHFTDIAMEKMLVRQKEELDRLVKSNERRAEKKGMEDLKYKIKETAVEVAKVQNKARKDTLAQLKLLNEKNKEIQQTIVNTARDTNARIVSITRTLIKNSTKTTVAHVLQLIEKMEKTYKEMAIVRRRGLESTSQGLYGISTEVQKTTVVLQEEINRTENELKAFISDLASDLSAQMSAMNDQILAQNALVEELQEGLQQFEVTTQQAITDAKQELIEQIQVFRDELDEAKPKIKAALIELKSRIAAIEERRDDAASSNSDNNSGSAGRSTRRRPAAAARAPDRIPLEYDDGSKIYFNLDTSLFEYADGSRAPNILGFHLVESRGGHITEQGILLDVAVTKKGKTTVRLFDADNYEFRWNVNFNTFINEHGTVIDVKTLELPFRPD